MLSRDTDQRNVWTPVQIPIVNPIVWTRLASISGYKTSEFSPIKYNSTEVVHFDQFVCLSLRNDTGMESKVYSIYLNDELKISNEKEEFLLDLSQLETANQILN